MGPSGFEPETFAV